MEWRKEAPPKGRGRKAPPPKKRRWKVAPLQRKRESSTAHKEEGRENATSAHKNEDAPLWVVMASPLIRRWCCFSSLPSMRWCCFLHFLGVVLWLVLVSRSSPLVWCGAVFSSWVVLLSPPFFSRQGARARKRFTVQKVKTKGEKVREDKKR